MSPPDPRRLFAEGLPIAAVLLLWFLPTWLSSLHGAASVIRDAGLVMALLYAFVRGAQLADEGAFDAPFDDLEAFLAANLSVLAVVAGWFVVGWVAEFVLRTGTHWIGSVGVWTFRTPYDRLLQTLATTGLATTVLYAVAVGLPAVRGGAAGTDTETPERRRDAAEWGEDAAGE